MLTAVLDEVILLDLTTTLTANQAAGTTVLPVTWAAFFDEDGGQLLLNGVTYTFVAVDQDANTITLAAPGLTAAASADDAVQLVTAEGDPATVKRAMVSLDDDGDPEEVIIPMAYDDYFVEGDTQAGIVVSLRARGDGWYEVGDAPGKKPVLDLTDAINPPDPTQVAVTAPTSSPGVRVSGNSEGLVVVTDSVLPSTLLDYYVDSVLVVANSRSTIQFLTTDSTGQPMTADGTYSITVVAHNAAGAAPASAAATGTLNSGVDPETIQAIVSAGYVLAGTIQVGSSITIDPDTGLTIYLATGGTINFPADGSTALIEAALRTSDMVVNGGLTINGTTNVVNGDVVYSAGLSDPIVLPGLYSAIGPLSPLTTAESGTSYLGLAKSQDGTKWLIARERPGYDMDLLEINAAGTTTNSLDMGGYTGLQPISITRGGSSYFVLGQRWTGSQWEYRVHRYDMTLTLTGSWFVTAAGGGHIVAPGDHLEGAIAFDADDSTLWFATRSGSNVLLRHYDLSGNYLGGLTTDTGTASQVAYGMVVGATDTGTKRIYVQMAGNSTLGFRVCVFSTGGARQQGEEFALNKNQFGMCWDGSNFFLLTKSGAAIAAEKYSERLTGRSFDVAYAWYDSDNTTGSGNHETRPTSRATFTIPNRGWLGVRTPAPPDNGSVDGADSVTLYTALSGGSLKLQGTYTNPSALSQRLDVPVGTGRAPSATNTFNAGSAVGRNLSAAVDALGPLWSFVGDGTRRLAGIDDPWTTYTSTVLVGTTAIANATVVARYRKSGVHTIEYDIEIRCTGTVGGAGVINATLPFTPVNKSSWAAIGSANTRDDSASACTAGTAVYTGGTNVSAFFGSTRLAATAPYTWAVNDLIHLAGEFQI